MGEKIAILKVLIVGLIVMGGLFYRKKTWRTRGFYASVTMNSVLFTALAVGIIVGYLSDLDVLSSLGTKEIHLSDYMVLASLPVGFVLYELVYKHQFGWGRTIAVTLAWTFLFSVLVGSGDPSLQKAALALVVVSGCFALGMINGILGPVLPALALAKVAAALFWGPDPQVWSMAGIVDTVQNAADLGLDALKILPAGVKFAGAVLLVVLGMGEAFQFYGLKPVFDRLFDHS
ncbi:hypothetical protein [Insolitispirillum peregrinum]|uniref:Uncharacterized protein n=1 Tax=Insolitispirillum peregrinum TaxID=80876 RepID=A0A1N7IIK4_9PROT|nr:hypothetical protein [Insolitispirillum peregrinum]SIS36934.1 hypothetical protein SAMN05421779_101152 [Insolitispirillum peregrinum]